MLNPFAFGFGSFSKRTPPGAPARPAGVAERLPRGGCQGFFRSRRLQDGPRWPPRCLQDGQDSLRWPPRWSQDASKTAKMASKTAKMAPRCTQDGLRWPQDGPRLPKSPPRGPEDGPRGLQELLQEGPPKPKSLSFLRFLKAMGHLPLFGLPTAQGGPRGPQDRPKIAQEASKMAP